MFGPLKPPPPIPSKQRSSDDGTRGARIQIRVLCNFLLRELLNNSDEEIEQVFKDYGSNYRDLYDNIIERVNNDPKTMQAKHGISRVSNIFDEYAGISIADRGFQAPEGVKVFKNVGRVNANGTFEPLPTLTPKVKAPMPSSPKIMNRFPPGTGPNDANGFISPTPPERKEPMNWPMAKRPTGSGRGINKIPANPKDVVVGDGSVFPPAHACSKSYRDVAVTPGLGQGRTLPQYILPGQTSSSTSVAGPIRTDVPDIKLGSPRPLTLEADNVWIPRINVASKFVTAYLRHGGQDERYNVHSKDGYVRVAVLVQLPEFKRHKIDHRVLEIIMMNAYPRIMTNEDGDRVKAIQGHSLEWFDIDKIRKGSHPRRICPPLFVGG